MFNSFEFFFWNQLHHNITLLLCVSLLDYSANTAASSLTQTSIVPVNNNNKKSIVQKTTMFSLPMTLWAQSRSEKQPVGATYALCIDAERGVPWTGIHIQNSAP